MSTKQLCETPVVASSATIRDCRLGRYTEVGARTSLTETVLDDYSYIVHDGEVMDTTIGKFCSIANHVRINPSNHPTWRATQHHFTYRSSQFGLGEDDAAFFEWRREHPVTLGHDVWLGHGVLIMPGVTVGTGAVVGSGAVVTRDVAPYAMVAGVPAKPLKERFSRDIQDKLLALAWWDWEHESLAAAMDDFRNLNIYAFVEKYG